MRQPMPKRIVATTSETHSGESSRPTSRWITSCARSRNESASAAKNGRSAQLLGDEPDAVADRVHRVDVLVGDLDVELVLEGEHDVDEPGGVHLEVVEDVGRVGDGGQRGLVLDVGGEDLHHLLEDLLALHSSSSCGDAAQAFHARKTTAAFTSPKPKPAFTAILASGSSRSSRGIDAAKGSISGWRSSLFRHGCAKRPRSIRSVATHSMARAAPSVWPIIDLVAVSGGNSAGPRSSAHAHEATSEASAPVAVRWPFTRSTSRPGIPASASASRTQRRTPAGLGAVMLPPPRWPPQLIAYPSTSAWMRAPRSRAASRLSSTSTPAPAPGTNPPALAQSGREAFSGSSLKRRQSTRIASKPAQM